MRQFKKIAISAGLTAFSVFGLYRLRPVIFGRPAGEPDRIPGPANIPAQFEQIHHDLPEDVFENGDVIFRQGNSPESHVVAMADLPFGYSHAGIVWRGEGGIFVIHASFGESGQTGENVVSQPIELFLDPRNAKAAVVYRFAGGDRAIPKTALVEAKRYLRERVPFDRDFDLENDDQIYCTELVWRAYGKAGVDLTAGRIAVVPFVLGKGASPVILPRSLLNSGLLNQVWSYP